MAPINPCLERPPVGGAPVFWRAAPGKGLIVRSISSNGHPAPDGGRVDLLERDKELARALPAAMRQGQKSSLSAGVLKLKRGPWEPDLRQPSVNHLGFMVLDGLVGRRVLVPERGRSLELLGRGDLFRPWQDESASFERLSWTVIEPAAIAVLDEPLAARAREMPEVMEALTDRALRRSRRLAVSAAIANTVGVQERLLLSLWQLAELWGKKAPEGAVLPFRLSHQTLADLVGARRPTVTLALRDLTQRDLLRRGEAGQWILVGDPP
jgi:CRP/FNR family cyclic AMP-dependent transcriptional regulator